MITGTQILQLVGECGMELLVKEPARHTPEFFAAEVPRLVSRGFVQDSSGCWCLNGWRVSFGGGYLTGYTMPGHSYNYDLLDSECTTARQAIDSLFAHMDAVKSLAK